MSGRETMFRCFHHRGAQEIWICCQECDTPHITRVPRVSGFAVSNLAGLRVPDLLKLKNSNVLLVKVFYFLCLKKFKRK